MEISGQTAIQQRVGWGMIDGTEVNSTRLLHPCKVIILLFPVLLRLLFETTHPDLGITL